MNTINNEKILYVVVPCYNEEECINECYSRLLDLRKDMKEFTVKYVFVNDGSADNTAEMLKNIGEKDSDAIIVDLEKNAGHQNAVRAGLSVVKIDKSKKIAIAIMDADLQDGPENIPLMVEKWEEGCYKNVYGQRLTRKGESWFKLTTANLFYRFMNFMTDGIMPKDTGDFRVVDQSLVAVVNSVPDKNMSLRAMWPSICSKNESFAFMYERAERFAGITHYPLSKMLKLAIDTILGYSVKPTKFIGLSGILFFMISAICFLVTIISLCTGVSATTWLIFTAINFVAGFMLICLYIVGEYVLRTFKQVQGIPNFRIKDVRNQ